MGLRSISSRGGQIRGLGTKVPHQGPGMEHCGGHSGGGGKASVLLEVLMHKNTLQHFHQRRQVPVLAHACGGPGPWLKRHIRTFLSTLTRQRKQALSAQAPQQPRKLSSATDPPMRTNTDGRWSRTASGPLAGTTLNSWTYSSDSLSIRIQQPTPSIVQPQIYNHEKMFRIVSFCHRRSGEVKG